MRIEQLEQVAAVARTGSFRNAADDLHISQPALSSAVRNLERELGVDLFERGRAGARVSSAGGELMPHVVAILDAVAGLRRSADDQHRGRASVRIGTVNAGTAPLVTPTLAAFRALRPDAHIEVVSAREAEIDEKVRDGAFDLGLVTRLSDDDVPVGFETTTLLRGRIVVCVHVGSALAEHDEVTLEALLEQPLILMRPGFLMHRYVHRLLGGRSPVAAYTTDGGEVGKLMVAQRLGAMVVPDFSIERDPLERAGLVTWRPLAGDTTEVHLAVRRRITDAHPAAARDLYRLLTEHAEGQSLAGALRR